MKAKFYLMILFGGIACIAYSQYNIPQSSGGNAFGNNVSNENSFSLLVGQNTIGVSSNGNYEAHFGLLSSSVSSFTGNKQYNSIDFEVGQNYPNPFQTSTTIPLKLIRESNVRLTILNKLGQIEEIVFEKTFSAGDHQIRYNAGKLSHGVHFFQIKIGNKHIAKPMLYSR